MMDSDELVTFHDRETGRAYNFVMEFRRVYVAHVLSLFETTGILVAQNPANESEENGETVMEWLEPDEDGWSLNTFDHGCEYVIDRLLVRLPGNSTDNITFRDTETGLGFKLPVCESKVLVQHVAALFPAKYLLVAKGASSVDNAETEAELEMERLECDAHGWSTRTFEAGAEYIVRRMQTSDNNVTISKGNSPISATSSSLGQKSSFLSGASALGSQKAGPKKAPPVQKKKALPVNIGEEKSGQAQSLVEPLLFDEKSW